MQKPRWFAAAVAATLPAVIAPAAAVAQAPATWQVSAKPLVEIGQVAGDSVYDFQRISSALFLPDGSIVVADAGQKVIRVFHPDGSFARQFGGEGGGPAEFRRIQGIWLTPGGDIGVWDPGNRRITTFTVEGKLLSSHRVEVGTHAEGLANLEVLLGRFGNGDVALASMNFGRPRGPSPLAFEQWRMARFSPDGTFRGELGVIEGMLRARGSPVPFSPVPYVAVRGDSMYVTAGYTSEISVASGAGKPVRKIPLPAVQAPPRDVWSLLEDTLQARKSTMLLEKLRQGQMPRSDRFPVVGGLLLDGRGDIWVKAYDALTDAVGLKSIAANVPAPGGEWRVLRPDGRFVAKVRIPANTIPLAVADDRLLGLSVDELGVQRVVVDRIVEPSP